MYNTFNEYFTETKSSFIHDVERGKNKALKKEKLKGGKADGMSLEDIYQMHKEGKHPDLQFKDLLKEFNKGLKIEMEHTKDKKVAGEIARDHLAGDSPFYYTDLENMERMERERDGMEAED